MKATPLKDYDYEIILEFVKGSHLRSAQKLAVTIDDFLQNMAFGGMSKSEMVAELMGPIGESRIFSPLLRQFGITSEKAIHTARQAAMREVYNKNSKNIKLYEWVLDSGAEHCDDCLARSGQEKTMEEWEMLGVPGSGTTVCNVNCKCDLKPVK